MLLLRCKERNIACLLRFFRLRFIDTLKRLIVGFLCLGKHDSLLAFLIAQGDPRSFADESDRHTAARTVKGCFICLNDQRTIDRCIIQKITYGSVQIRSKPVADRHLENSFQDTTARYSIGCLDMSGFHTGQDLIIQDLGFFIVRRQIILQSGRKVYQNITGLFQFRGHDVIGIGRIHRQRNQRGRYVDLVEGTTHGVLAADRRKSEGHLRLVSAEQSRKRFAPAGRIFVHPLEEFLECEPDLPPVRTGSNRLRDGFHHRIGCTVERAPGGNIGIISVSHGGSGLGFSVEHRDLCDHGLNRCFLEFAAKGHQDCRGTDR